MPKPGIRLKARQKALPTEADEGIVGADGRCNCLKRDGVERCMQKAGFGTDHYGYGACQFHGGNSPSLKRHAAKVRVREIAVEMEMEPEEALSWMVRLAAGMVGYIQTKMAESPTELEALQWAEAYGEERDRLAKSAKLMLDSGLAERAVRVAEEQGAMLAAVIRAILGDLALTPTQVQAAPAIVRRHLLALPVASGG